MVRAKFRVRNDFGTGRILKKLPDSSHWEDLLHIGKQGLLHKSTGDQKMSKAHGGRVGKPELNLCVSSSHFPGFSGFSRVGGVRAVATPLLLTLTSILQGKTNITPPPFFGSKRSLKRKRKTAVHHAHRDRMDPGEKVYPFLLTETQITQPSRIHGQLLQTPLRSLAEVRPPPRPPQQMSH